MEGLPVQFLPAYNSLVEEAIEQAVETPYRSEATRVPRPEHLAAIMVQTGRDKDRARLESLMEQVQIDREFLGELLVRHGLAERFDKWIDRTSR